MDLSVKLSVSDAEKRVYLLKLLHTALTVVGFVVGYNVTGNYQLGMLGAVVLAFGSAGAVGVNIAGAFAGAIAFTILGGLTGAFTFSAFMVGFPTALSGLAVFAITTRKSQNISDSSNLISGVIQFLLTWYLLHLAQYLHISVSWG